MTRVLIAGGGISGLATAYFLEQLAAERNLEIWLLESRKRLGGLILTDKVGGFTIEAGPDSFLSQKPAALDLCERLGLTRRLIHSNDHLRKTYVLRQGKLVELPEGLEFIVPTKVMPVLRTKLLSLRGKLRLSLEPILPSRRADVDESVAAFIRRRLGREVLDYIVEPLLAGVYGGDVEKLSARAILPQLVAMEREHGSIVRGALASKKARENKEGGDSRSSIFVSLKGGMQELIDALASGLRRTRIVMGTRVVRVISEDKSNYRVLLADGQILNANAVVLATPAYIAAELVKELDRPLAGLLDQIPYTSSATVSLAYDRRKLPDSLGGFGFVVPKVEGRKVIACTFTSIKFSRRCPPDYLLVRCFLGGARDDSFACEDEGHIAGVAQRELAEIIGVDAEPALIKVHCWEKAMPQYVIGHQERLRQIESRASQHAGLFLTGNAYYGVGIPDCVRLSFRSAQAILRYLEGRGNPPWLHSQDGHDGSA